MTVSSPTSTATVTRTPSGFTLATRGITQPAATVSAAAKATATAARRDTASYTPRDAHPPGPGSDGHGRRWGWFLVAAALAVIVACLYRGEKRK